MALVDYSSDSESDDEKPTVQEKKEQPKRPGSILNSLPPKKHASVDKKKVILEVPQLREEKKDPIDKVIEVKSVKTNSISSFLPAPKNRKGTGSTSTTTSNYSIFKKSNTRVLGGGIKNTFFDGEISMPGDLRDDGYDSDPASNITPINKSSLTLVPASIAARKAKNSKVNESNVKRSTSEKPKASLELPSLFSFHTESQSKSESASISTDYKPILLEEPESDLQEYPTTTTPSSKTLFQHAADSGIEINRFESRNQRNNRSQENINIVDFKVDEFYEENQRLKASGKLDENIRRPIGSMSGGKHQLTSLIRNAQQNQERLEEGYAESRKNKTESGKKYGF